MTEDRPPPPWLTRRESHPDALAAHKLALAEERITELLKATEQPIDTSTAAGKCFLDMLGVFTPSKPTCGTNL